MEMFWAGVLKSDGCLFDLKIPFQPMKAEFQGRFQGEAKAKEAVPRSLHLKKNA